MNYRRAFVMGAVLVAVAMAPSSASAQTPKIYLDVDEVTTQPGELVSIPIFIENLPDSIDAFQMGLTLSRPDLMEFREEIDLVGTLTEDWGNTVNSVGGFDLSIVAGAAVTGYPYPIPPNTNGVLLKLLCDVYCDIPDTMQDRTVDIYISPINTFFSNTEGNLIEPLDLTEGSVTVGLRCPHQGDAEPDGFITALDLSAMVAVLFESGPNPQDPCCPTYRLDFDCDGFTTALDMAKMVDYLFAGGLGPCNPDAR